MKPGDVILISCPFTDLSITKIRPAVVVSTYEYNQRQSDVIIVPITRNIARTASEDIRIEPTDREFQQTGLKAASAVKVGKIFTLDRDLAKRHLGRLSEGLLEKIRLFLKNLLEIP